MTSNRAIEKDRPNAAAASGPAVSHPLDEWLRRELRALQGTEADQALPDDIAALAKRLEERLSEGGGRGEAPGDAPTGGGDPQGQD